MCYICAINIFSPAIAVVCPALSRPENGIVTLNGVTFGSLATYVCNTGFVLDGNVQRMCLATGEWSGSDPSCIGEGEDMSYSFPI